MKIQPPVCHLLALLTTFSPKSTVPTASPNGLPSPLGQLPTLVTYLGPSVSLPDVFIFLLSLLLSPGSHPSLNSFLTNQQAYAAPSQKKPSLTLVADMMASALLPSSNLSHVHIWAPQPGNEILEAELATIIGLGTFGGPWSPIRNNIFYHTLVRMHT